MKSKLYILALFFPFTLLAQVQPEIILLEKYTARQVGQMAIFPGCEKEDPNNKGELTKCMSTELNKLLGNSLSKFSSQFAAIYI